MPHQMTHDETMAFLAEGTRTGKVATVRADGSPHIAPIWFVVDGDDLVFMTGAGTVKGKSLLRDPRAALTVDLEELPYGFVMVEGTVTLSTDLDEMLPWSTAIAERYVDAADVETYARRNTVDGELLVRLRPTKVVAVGDMAGH